MRKLQDNATGHVVPAHITRILARQTGNVARSTTKTVQLQPTTAAAARIHPHLLLLLLPPRNATGRVAHALITRILVHQTGNVARSMTTAVHLPRTTVAAAKMLKLCPNCPC